MKRLRSSEDLDSCTNKAASKEWVRKDEESGSNRSLFRTNSYHKSQCGRKPSSSFARHDRIEEDGDSSRPLKKRLDYDVDGYDRRKSYDRYRDRDGSGETGVLITSPQSGYGAERFRRSESFTAIKRDFPKGFRSERDRSRREGSVSSWRSFSGGKDTDEGIKSSGESVKINQLDTDDVGKVKYSKGSKDAKSKSKSPPWSKNSGSEHSKSIDVKKYDQSVVESGGNISEMEEGELEPESEPERSPLHASEPTAQEQTSSDSHDEQKLVKKQPLEEHNHQSERANFYSEEDVELNKVSVQKQQIERSLSKDYHGMLKNAHQPVDFQTVKQVESSVHNGDFEVKTNNAGDKDEERSGENILHKDEALESFPTKQHNVIDEQRGDKYVDDVHVRGDETTLRKLNDPPPEPNGASPLISLNAMVKATDSFSEQDKIVSYGDHYNEGPPSTRGLDLFISDPIKKTKKDITLHMNDKAKDEKLTLDLSLSLPNVLLPIGYRQSDQTAPGSPSRAQSFHSSFRTASEGYTGSMSFSGSHQFSHNPSCSLTHDLVDYEQSVKSRPLFQGVDWQALASEDQYNNEVQIVQNMFQKANVLSQHLQASQGHSSGQPLTNQRTISQGGLRTTGQERQLSFSKHFPGVQPHKVKNVGSYETGSGSFKDKKRSSREMDGASYSDGRGQLWSVGSDFVESIINMVCSDPLNAVSQKFNEMSIQQLTIVKDSARDIIMNPSKQFHRTTFQRNFVNRSDITIETLMLAHRTQLEILVSMKTNVLEFLQSDIEISSTDLAEIFLNLRCRNITCRNLLPVDECDCKICSKKGGFCSSCMCIVCSKFDMASNTCSWVGCDVCLHWCHVDCGLRESHIRVGFSVLGGDDGTPEMQFHCIACDHPSEMFGFVKEVFLNFAKEWTVDMLSRELEYVRRIFCSSEDVRGKRLHGIAVQLLSDLKNNVDLHQIQRYLLRFFYDPDDFFKHDGSTLTLSRRELMPLKNDVENNVTIIGSTSRETERKRSSSSSSRYLDMGGTHQSDKAVALSGDGNFFKNDDKLHKGLKLDAQTRTSDLLPSGADHLFDEIESMVRIKKAEAEMFQARADDARREAEALKRITVTKNEKIEEKYASRISKLRLGDAEEMRKQKIEELKGVERGYQEYFHMKMRMEAEIKDMLLKMEATRRNLNS